MNTYDLSPFINSNLTVGELLSECDKGIVCSDIPFYQVKEKELELYVSCKTDNGEWFAKKMILFKNYVTITEVYKIPTCVKPLGSNYRNEQCLEMFCNMDYILSNIDSVFNNNVGKEIKFDIDELRIPYLSCDLKNVDVKTTNLDLNLTIKENLDNFKIANKKSLALLKDRLNEVKPLFVGKALKSDDLIIYVRDLFIRNDEGYYKIMMENDLIGIEELDKKTIRYHINGKDSLTDIQPLFNKFRLIDDSRIETIFERLKDVKSTKEDFMFLYL